MRVFLVNQNNAVAMSLTKKLTNAKHGQFIPVTPEEMKFYKSGMMVLDIPEDVSGTRITVGGSAAPEKTEPPKAEPAKVTESPKPLGTAPKPPVSGGSQSSKGGAS